MSEGGWIDLLMLVLLGVVLVLVGLILARRTKADRARRTRDRRWAGAAYQVMFVSSLRREPEHEIPDVVLTLERMSKLGLWLLQDEQSAIDTVTWLWEPPVGLLLGTIFGLVVGKWPFRRRGQPDRASSVTDLGESFAFVNELRREIARLRQVNARLQADRTESRAALARVADSLEREARRLPVQRPGTDTSAHQ